MFEGASATLDAGKKVEYFLSSPTRDSIHLIDKMLAKRSMGILQVEVHLAVPQNNTKQQTRLC
jgi:hypothetical protein